MMNQRRRVIPLVKRSIANESVNGLRIDSSNSDEDVRHNDVLAMLTIRSNRYKL